MIVKCITVKLVSLAYGTAVGYLPALATYNGVSGPVPIEHLELHQQLRPTVVCGVVDSAPLQVVCVVARGSEASWCEDYADGVCAAFV